MAVFITSSSYQSWPVTEREWTNVL
jgi:hypothetical protein